MSPEPAIQFDGVSFGYNGETVLKDVSLVIESLDFAWIVGPNGGGKTTLLKLMLGLITPRSGKIRILGKSPRQARQVVGYMPQQSRLDPQFPVDVLDVVMMGRLTNFSPIGIVSRRDRAAAMAVLDEVGLADQYKRPFADLSGGQQRRVLIARAMAAGPELLLLDEPTANLDIRVEQDVYELLQRLNDHLTIVMVSHDPAFVSPFVKSVVCVNRSVHVHPTASIDEQIMDELYGRPIKLIRHDKHFE